MDKAIYFDLDGTIVDFYGEPNWLADLEAERVNPYVNASPKINIDELRAVIKIARMQGYTVGVITWLAGGSSKSFKQETAKAKKEWLARMALEFDEIHMVKYGTAKHLVPRVRKSILVDDNATVREQWIRYGGLAIDAEPKTWIKELRKILR